MKPTHTCWPVTNCSWAPRRWATMKSQRRSQSRGAANEFTHACKIVVEALVVVVPPKRGPMAVHACNHDQLNTADSHEYLGGRVDGRLKARYKAKRKQKKGRTEGARLDTRKFCVPNKLHTTTHPHVGRFSPTNISGERSQCLPCRPHQRRHARPHGVVNRTHTSRHPRGRIGDVKMGH